MALELDDRLEAGRVEEDQLAQVHDHELDVVEPGDAGELGVEPRRRGEVQLPVEADERRRGRFTVSDAGGGETPALRETGGAKGGGYGLHLVDRIADDWGVTHASMHVWFDLSY